MRVMSGLRRKREEIEASIAACEARIEAARMDLAALDRVIGLFDPEVRRDGIAPGCERDDGEGRPPTRHAAGGEVSRQCGARNEAGRGTPEDRRGEQGERRGAAGATSEPIPEEFFYLDWP